VIYKIHSPRCPSGVRKFFQRWMPFALVAAMIGLPVGLYRHTGSPGARANDDNPNKFYLFATGKEFSMSYTYDPHAADLWMFRTAEGHLMVSGNGRGISNASTNGVRNAEEETPAP